MKASELITKLQQRIAKLGDLEVVIPDKEEDQLVPVNWVVGGCKGAPNPDPFVDDPCDYIVLGHLRKKR